jgi:hypothetical protein
MNNLIPCVINEPDGEFKSLSGTVVTVEEVKIILLQNFAKHL